MQDQQQLNDTEEYHHTRRRRITAIFRLTDGDIHGSVDLDDLLRYARHHKIGVFTIGVEGSDKESLQQQLGKTQVIYVEDIHDLPEKMRKLAIRKA